MKKNIMITLWVDDYPLGEIESLQEKLDELVEDYENKRVNIQIRDEPTVRLTRPQ